MIRKKAAEGLFPSEFPRDFLMGNLQGNSPSAAVFLMMCVLSQLGVPWNPKIRNVSNSLATNKTQKKRVCQWTEDYESKHGEWDVIHEMSYTICDTLDVIHLMWYTTCDTRDVIHYMWYTRCDTLDVIHSLSYTRCDTLMWYTRCDTLDVIHDMSYRVAKTHRIPYLYMSFPEKVTYI